MKKLTEQLKRINFKYFFTELLIVVAGILIAVSLNSWREDNADKNREQFYLNSLKTDFEQSLASLNEIHSQNLESDSSLRRLILVIGNNDANVSPDLTKKLLSGHLFGFNRFVPGSGTYKEIISTGSLEILRDNELRIALSSWEDMITRNQQLEDVMFWQYHLINIPYLNKHIVRADFKDSGDNAEPHNNFRTDFKKLFTDTEFENILINRVGALEEANEYINIMIEQVNHIINLIDKGLAE
jgi:hypothetical protein